jgi:hypothetical protein
MRGEQKKKSAKLNLKIIDAANSDSVLLIGARSISVSLLYTENEFKSEANNLLRFSYSWGHHPKVFALLGGQESTLKLKTTAKLRSKQTSIPTVRDLYRMYAPFLTPLGSHYRVIRFTELHYLHIKPNLVRNSLLVPIGLHNCEIMASDKDQYW